MQAERAHERQVLRSWLLGWAVLRDGRRSTMGLADKVAVVPPFQLAEVDVAV